MSLLLLLSSVGCGGTSTGREDVVRPPNGRYCSSIVANDAAIADPSRPLSFAYICAPELAAGSRCTFMGVSRTRVAMVDLNGDGLPDRVTRNRADFDAQGRPFWLVQFNSGEGFAPEERWMLPPWPEQANDSVFHPHPFAGAAYF